MTTQSRTGNRMPGASTGANTPGFFAAIPRLPRLLPGARGAARGWRSGRRIPASPKTYRKAEQPKSTPDAIARQPAAGAASAATGRRPARTGTCPSQAWSNNCKSHATRHGTPAEAARDLTTVLAENSTFEPIGLEQAARCANSDPESYSDE